MKKRCLSILTLLFMLSCFAQSYTLKDSRDGKTYKTVKIGDQLWMAENLAYDCGIGYWAYDNVSENVSRYGYLYNWESAKYSCPSGWRLPSKNDFENLLNNTNGNATAAYDLLIKSRNSGFSVTYGGWRDHNGSFSGIGESARFWSSSPNYDNYSWNLFITGFSSKAYLIFNSPSFACSVRCIKDN